MALLRFDRVCGTVYGYRVEYRRLSDEEREIRGPHGVIGQSPFAYIGRVNGGFLELWKENGRYREDDTPHHLDLALVLSHKGYSA